MRALPLALRRPAELDWDHHDPYGRLLVAATLRLGLPLVTGDAAITELGAVDVLW